MSSDLQTLSVDSVIEQWKSDSLIDRSELGEESLRIEQLHDKYMKLYALAKKNLRLHEAALRRARLEKFEWYTQGPTKEGHAKGWKILPQGKVLRTDAWQYVDADPQVIEVALAAGEAQDVVDAIKDKLSMIAARGFRISDAIRWELFRNGK